MSSNPADIKMYQPFVSFVGHLKEYDKRADSYAKKILEDDELMREIAFRCVLKHGFVTLSFMGDSSKTFNQLMNENPALKVARAVIEEVENHVLTLGGRRSDHQKYCLVPHAKILSGEFKSAGLREQFTLAGLYPEIIKAVPVATCEVKVVRQVSYKHPVHFPVLLMDESVLRLKLIPEPLDPSIMFLALAP